MTKRLAIRTATLLFAALVCGIVLTDRAIDGQRGNAHHWRMAVADQVAGCCVAGGERYGFVADLADSLSARCAHTIDISLDTPIENMLEGMRTGTLDIAVIPAYAKEQFEEYHTESLYTTNYILVMPRWASSARGINSTEAWKGKRVLSDISFHHTATFQQMSTSGVRCDTTLLDGLQMAQRMVSGGADAIICEPSDAELIRFLYRDLRAVGTIEEPYEVILVFADGHTRHEFNRALEEFSLTEDYATMVDIYFGETSVAERFTHLNYRPTRVIDGISIWDKQLKQISARVGVDWRLMSAMAYHESRFRNNQVSNRGAVGLMQVTPIVIEDLRLEGEYDLSDPSTNITLAAKLLRRSSRALGFGDFPATNDQMAIMVASYNCGIGRTMEAQRLVEVAGGNPHSWSDVSEMFLNMNDAKWVAANDCRVRRFRDARITIAYTNGVMELYDTYCTAIE